MNWLIKHIVVDGQFSVLKMQNFESKYMSFSDLQVQSLCSDKLKWKHLYAVHKIKVTVCRQKLWKPCWHGTDSLRSCEAISPGPLFNTVDSRYLAPVGSQNSRARVKWFSRYLALSREGHDSRIQDHRHTLPGVYNSQTVCWAIIQVLTFPGSLHTSTSHQRQITTSNIRF